MPTLTLNGIAVPVREVRPGQERIAGRVRTYLGNAQDGTRAFKRTWRCITPPLPYVEASAYAGLVQGLGDRVPFTHWQGTRSDRGRDVTGAPGAIVTPDVVLAGQSGCLQMDPGQTGSWTLNAAGTQGVTSFARRWNRARTGVTHILWTVSPAGLVYGCIDGVNVAYGRESFWDFGHGSSGVQVWALDASVSAWAPSLTGLSGEELRVPTSGNAALGNVYMRTAGSATGATEPTWPTTYGQTVTEAVTNGVTWKNIGRRQTQWYDLAHVPYFVPSTLWSTWAQGQLPSPRPVALGDLISSSGVAVQGTVDGREDVGSGSTIRSTLTFTLREV